MVVQSYLEIEHPNQIDFLYVIVSKRLHTHWCKLSKKKRYWAHNLQYLFKEWRNCYTPICGMPKNTKHLVWSDKKSEDW